MGLPQSYNNQVPFGKMSITAAGSTVLLSVNCGPFGGQVANRENYLAPPVPGATAQYFVIEADVNNSGNIYLLPRGKTVASNPSSIMAQIAPGGYLPFPFAAGGGPGLQPENFCLDTDAVSGTQLAYGYATLNG